MGQLPQVPIGRSRDAPAAAETGLQVEGYGALCPGFGSAKRLRP